MRPRTIILLILVLVVAAAAVVLFVVFGLDGGPFADLLPGGGEPETEVVEPVPEETGPPPPTPTPEVNYVPVVVSTADLPVGERLRSDLLAVESRPETNVAVQNGATFSDPELLVGKIVRVAVSRGQELLRPMIALNPSDITATGSDLSLYVDQGEVAVAFPINQFSGAAYAMRPGDLVDAFMTIRLVDIDEQFQTKRPNIWERVYEPALLAGEAFLFPPTSEGRLELISAINTVAVIGPGAGKEPIPRRTTQLTLQQMEVLWVGSWRDPRESLSQEFNADAVTSSEPSSEQPAPVATKQRPEDTPDVVILSMSAQDAASLKWAMDTGISIDLVLRAQADNSVFVTTSVSLPQALEQGVLTVPEAAQQGLEPRIDLVPTPGLPPSP